MYIIISYEFLRTIPLRIIGKIEYWLVWNLPAKWQARRRPPERRFTSLCSGRTWAASMQIQLQGSISSCTALLAEGVGSSLPVQRKGRATPDRTGASQSFQAPQGGVNNRCLSTEESQVCGICNPPRRSRGWGGQEQKTNLCQVIVLQIFLNMGSC